jgi:hypothetical protein
MRGKEERSMLKKVSLGLATLGAAAGGYVLFVRPWLARWGATDEEVQRLMPGDELVEQPMLQVTYAITIKARPEQIWPWLVQMGSGRAGFYSYDWLDRLFGYLDRASAQQILPEFQHLEVGEMIMDGTVANAIEPNRSLVLATDTSVLERTGTEATWVFGLYPLDEEHTRLVSRSRGHWRLLTPMGIFILLFYDLPIFVMLRKMLLGIKRRAEKMHEVAGATGQKLTVDKSEAV